MSRFINNRLFGFSGPGNSCYLRAAFQSIVSSNLFCLRLEEYLKNTTFHIEKKLGRNEQLLVEQWKQIRDAVNASRTPTLTPEMVSSLREIPGIPGEAYVAADELISRLPIYLKSVFDVTSETRMRCLSCGFKCMREEVNTSWPVYNGWKTYLKDPIQNSVTFIRHIGLVKDIPSNYKCDGCQKVGTSEKKQVITGLADTVILTRVRNSNAEEPDSDLVNTLPEFFEIPICVDEKQLQNQQQNITLRRYNLRAILYALSSTGGHFITHRNIEVDGKCRSVICNDSSCNITSVEPRNGTSFPFIFVYERE